MVLDDLFRIEVRSPVLGARIVDQKHFRGHESNTCEVNDEHLSECYRFVELMIQKNILLIPEFCYKVQEAKEERREQILKEAFGDLGPLIKSIRFLGQEKYEIGPHQGSCRTYNVYLKQKWCYLHVAISFTFYHTKGSLGMSFAVTADFSSVNSAGNSCSSSYLLKGHPLGCNINEMYPR